MQQPHRALEVKMEEWFLLVGLHSLQYGNKIVGRRSSSYRSRLLRKRQFSKRACIATSHSIYLAYQLTNRVFLMEIRRASKSLTNVWSICQEKLVYLFHPLRESQCNLSSCDWFMLSTNAEKLLQSSVLERVELVNVMQIHTQSKLRKQMSAKCIQDYSELMEDVSYIPNSDQGKNHPIYAFEIKPKWGSLSKYVCCFLFFSFLFFWQNDSIEIRWDRWNKSCVVIAFNNITKFVRERLIPCLNFVLSSCLEILQVN